MRRLLLTIALLLALGIVLMPDRGTKKTKTETDSLSVSAAAPEERAPLQAANNAGTEAEEGDRREAAATIVPSRYFPNAKVLSRVEIRDEASGELKVIKTVETNLKEPFVTVEEVYSGNESAANLIGQAAMVANQLLVAPVEGVSDEKMIAVMRRAGAVDVKKSGENFLATFPALPDDPRAVEIFKERLIASADFVLEIEPNYIRKIF